jgi:hypothetical protein
MPSRKSKPKRKATEAPEAVVSSEGESPKETKARRMSSDASSPTAASSNTDAPAKTETGVVTANAASVSDTPPEETLESIGALVQDLFHSDNAKVNAALDALFLNLLGNKKKCEKIRDVGGCFALVQLVKNCLEKASEKIAACDQVTELNELVELKTLNESIRVITNLSYDQDNSAGITAIGGVEAVVKVMKTFPKCRNLQLWASRALLNLTCENIIGKNKAVKTGGIDVLLAAVNNHLDSAIVCEKACCALILIVIGSKENIGLLISLGGATAVAKVRAKWSDNEHVQIRVRAVATLIASEMKTWAHEE